MFDIIAFQNRILMYYCYQYCYRCRFRWQSGREILGSWVFRGPESSGEGDSVNFLYISLAGKGHRGLTRTGIQASNIACLYGKLETSKGAMSDFEEGPRFPCGGYGGEAVQLFSDGPAN